MKANATSLWLTDPDASLAETLSLLLEREFRGRRRMLGRLGGAALLASPAGALACSLIPSETGGPYPGDGTNGPNALTQSGIVRSDIRASFGSAGTSIAAGTPLTVTLKLVNVNNNCVPVAGYAVYLWHCDAQGRYSMYSSGVTTQNYLRGVLQLATTGNVTSGYTASLEVGIAAAVSAAAPDLDQHGLTGNWYNAGSDGQGLSLEIYPDLLGTGQGLLFGGWFTFDTVPGDATANRWYTVRGPVLAGQATGSLVINRNVGGNFEHPPVTTSTQVGTATFNATTCDSGTLTYSFSDGSARTGTIALTRLTQNVTCSTTTARATHADFAYSGNWFSEGTSGQGFVFELNPSSLVMFVTWYTYAQNGQSLAGPPSQRWYTAKTTYSAGARSFTLTLYETTGGVFASTPATTVAVGTATLAFTSCSTANFVYSFASGSNAGQAGTIALTRIGPTPSGCA